MSSKIEVSRELAERLALPLEDSRGWTTWNTAVAYEAAKELRALLAAPVVERQPDAIIEGCMTSVGITHAIYASTVSLKDKEQVRLYREPSELAELQATIAQHAAEIERLKGGQGEPVALPDPKPESSAWGHDMGGNYDEGHADGWNACLDKVKELNQ